MAAIEGSVTFLRVLGAALSGEWEECRTGWCAADRPCGTLPGDGIDLL